jgi:hypothetical protein
MGRIKSDSNLKIIRTITVPEEATWKVKSSKNPQSSKNPLVLNVYSEHGPLLVTRAVGADETEFRITHARTLFAFGNGGSDERV